MIVTAVLDSCHSGGATRGAEEDATARGGLEPDEVQRTPSDLVAPPAELTASWLSQAGGARGTWLSTPACPSPKRTRRTTASPSRPAAFCPPGPVDADAAGQRARLPGLGCGCRSAGGGVSRLPLAKRRRLAAGGRQLRARLRGRDGQRARRVSLRGGGLHGGGRRVAPQPAGRRGRAAAAGLSAARGAGFETVTQRRGPRLLQGNGAGRAILAAIFVVEITEKAPMKRF